MDVSLHTKEYFERVYKDYSTTDKKEIVREAAKVKVDGYKVVIIVESGVYRLGLEPGSPNKLFLW